MKYTLIYPYIRSTSITQEAPSNFDIKDRTTYGEMLEIRDCLTILNLLNITVLTYSDNKAFTEIGKISSKKPSDVKTHLESIFKDNHLERFLAKIYVFNLTMFDRILFLDNDIIPLLNFEDLFHVPMTPACAADVASGMVLNTGVMVIDPSREIFEAIVHDLMRDDPNPWRSANKDGVASPVTEWGAFIEDSGRFINWLLKFKRNKRLVKMIHMGNPKPNWPLWTKDCTENSDNGSDDSLNGWKIPSKWPCPDGKTSRPDWWRWYFIESGEPGLAILSIHKTFWKRYVDEVATMCQKFSSAAQTTAKTTSLTSITSRICKYPYIVTSDMKHAGWYETILPTKSIKVWSELLQFDLVWLASNPLTYVERKGPNSYVHSVHPLDLITEQRALAKTLTESGMKLRFKRDYATIERLSTNVILGCRVLHYTGHGIPSGLGFETDSGHMHLNGGVELVFVAACHSEPAGMAFVKAKVKHVIAVRVRERVQDEGARHFQNQFYLGLVRGRTVKDAFDFAQKSLQSIPGLLHAKDEAKKYLLLPETADHNVRIFPDLSRGEVEDHTKALSRTNLPTSVPQFMGRNPQVQNIVQKFLSKKSRLVTLVGERNVGKTAISIDAARYMHDRGHFKNGVFWMRFEEFKAYSSEQTIVEHIAATMDLIEDTSSSQKPIVRLLTKS
eukprot:jgi/Bigna1/139177/aug1.49_g13885